MHDPSVVRADDAFYVFGSHLASASTTDWLQWTQISTSPAPGNPLAPDAATEFAEALAWVETDTFWAPDVIQLGDGRYYLYYCVGRLDAPRAALGLAVSDSITGPYENLGIMLRSGMWGEPSHDGTIYDPTRHPNTVDPDVFFDEAGRLWMVYGSYSGGIFILEMDPATGFPLPGQGYGRKLIGGNHARIEGAFMLYSPESEYWYMFVSFGGLAADGGYNIRVGRSRQPDGPFLDATGNDLTHVAGAPGTLFDDASIAPFGVKLMGNYHFLPEPGEPAATTTGYVSPGHNSAYYDPLTGRHFLVFHTRFVGRGEEHQVRVHQLYLNADDWLVAAPHRYAGVAPGRVQRADVPGDYKLINHGKAISPAVNESQLVTLRPNGTITGAVSGTWRFFAGGNLELTLAGVTYCGVVSTEWDHDHGAWVHAFSALSRDGVAVWGSKLVVDPHPRVERLRDRQALHGHTFALPLPEPRGDPKKVHSYSLTAGPSGLTVDRETGEIIWQPTLSQVGLSHEVVARAVDIAPDAADHTLYVFSVTALSANVVRRLDLDFGSAAAGGLQDAGGEFTGLTARLPGTGGDLPTADPNLHLDPAAGHLVLSTTQADFFGGAGLATASVPGAALADLGFTGAEDFAVTAQFAPLVGLEFIDQVGVYVGASSAALTRAGTIVFGAPERYAVHSENFADHSARFFGFGLDVSDGMTVTITREGGGSRYFIDGVEWNPLAPATFLDGRADLTAGVFAITPLNANVKPVGLDSFSLVVATTEPQLTALEQWRIIHFAQLEAIGVAANHADPDRDGRRNFQEFELSTDPWVAD